MSVKGTPVTPAPWIFVSCEKETEGISRVTVYPEISLKGDALLFIEKGTFFDDPGVTAMEGIEDITSSVTIIGSLDTNKGGLYHLIYNAQNKDGFSARVERTIHVYDPKSVTLGYYNTNIERLPSGSYSDLSVLIYGISATEIYISDLLGGYYAQGRNYGPTYAPAAILSILSDNTINLISGGFVAGWGDYVKSCTGTYDPTTKVITISTEYAGMTFNSTFVL